MAFSQRWFLILSALILGGGPLVAASGREDRAFAAATATLQDENWSRASTEFAQFIQRFPKSDRVPAAVLAQAQAQFKQGKFSETLALLSQPSASAGALADRYAYWRGEAQFAQGDFSQAAETFSAVAKNFPDSALSLTAVVEAAAAFQRLNDWPQLIGLLGATNGVFARTAARDEKNEMVVRGRLLLAQAQFARGNFPEAVATINALEQKTLPPDLDWQRANLLCRLQLALGDLDAALMLSTNLWQTARRQNDPVRLADSVAWHAEVLEKKSLWPEAVAAWSENLTATNSTDRQREAVLKIATLAGVQKNSAAAVAALENYLKEFDGSKLAELVWLTLGELHLKDFAANGAAEQLAQAQKNLDQFLATFPASSLAGIAYLNRGWCGWLNGKYAEARDDFYQAAQRLPVSENLAVARFKIGDALFQLNDFAGARTNYQAVLTGFADYPEVAKSLGAPALYQILRADIALMDTNGAAAAMAELLDKFPASELADDSRLLLGQACADFRMPEKAREVLLPFARQFPGSPLLPQVELALARTFEREQNWPAAITNYEAWLQSHPTNDLLPQAQYALARAQDRAGHETNALQLFSSLAANFPTNDLAPLAQWWVADYFYRAGNFVGAETNYELIFQTPAWKNSTNLFYKAQLMAGRAAAGRLGFRDAADYLTKLVSDTNCPAALATQAMFAYGGVLMRMDSPDTNRLLANFELATNVFMQIYLANSTNDLGALACSELGDCNLQLGAFDAATNAFAQVAASPYAGLALRNRAQVGLGRVLEKRAEAAPPEARRALQHQALEIYWDVVYDQTADLFWAKKAGLQALPLMAATGEGNLEKFFGRLEILLPQLKASLEKKKLALGAVKN